MCTLNSYETKLRKKETRVQLFYSSQSFGFRFGPRVFSFLIRASWVSDMTSSPCRLNMRPVTKPRPPCADGLSISYNNQSSAFTGLWIQIEWSRLSEYVFKPFCR
uniref:Acyl-CoA thioesterase family protein n=1 Tax=Arundo donax TaxID=35708 RepID=A0A0A9EMF3_ARUDO